MHGETAISQSLRGISQPSRGISQPTRGRKPWAFVVRDVAPEEAAAPVDWSSWYLTDEEDMSEGVEQSDIITLLTSVLSVHAEERGWKDVYVGKDNFFAWVQKEPLVRVSPDVYLLDNAPPPPRPASWQTWLPGHNPPRFAVEVVSEDWKKDYEDNPPKYAQLGVQELVIFDPSANSSRKGRIALQVYRRGPDGAFILAYSDDGPVYSEQLAAWLVVVPEGDASWLRVARDAAGKDLVPSAKEQTRLAEERIRSLEEQLAKLQGR